MSKELPAVDAELQTARSVADPYDLIALVVYEKFRKPLTPSISHRASYTRASLIIKADTAVGEGRVAV